MKTTENILKKSLSGKRITEDEALTLLKEGELTQLGETANELRKKFHPEDIVTFVIDRNINYTNICESKCKFCAFYREKTDPDAYVLDKDEIFSKIDETLELGGTQIMLQGGLNPDLKIDYYTDLLSAIKSNYKIHIHSFSPPEIAHISKNSGLSLRETLSELKKAGLDSLPGGGAEILVDHIRHQISPNKIGAELWLNVMEEAHSIGLRATATMMMGSLETIEDRILHLSRLRALQDKTGVFRAFIPWTFQPGHTELGGKKTSGVEYLKMLAVSRIFMDNFEHVQGSWVTQGKDIGQIALHFGANDLGSIMIEENVVASTGVCYKMSKDQIINMIKKAGFVPAQRNTRYEILETFN
ncbi:cyclic dehypoxanthinyl futalosine synthase [Candidatus Oleimmundimicrobium sp.]|uniref:cyclic dehypoxanthinyl futalosine synthase n=1 Tax=Candidatus Oleimmundimicrobium sp. TaxID=3060597 RepID=UPI0027290CD2|nr:cyclic dehypoxanthinyl futalosine synthase [Candidatus Oleimmundimicrobium sp.]MDO8885907.1 cyclic dehypoxanthinyl futalosine synthase [Candidatus Oleimmundimicrobium sp.]